MNVRDIMRREVRSIRQNISLKETIQIFVKHCVPTLPVTDDQNRVVGLLTVNDLVDIFLPRYVDMLRDYATVNDYGQLEPLFGESYDAFAGLEERLILAADVMNLKVPPLYEDDSLIHAAAALQTTRVSRLPVISRSGELVGIISETAIMLALLSGHPVVA